MSPVIDEETTLSDALDGICQGVTEAEDVLKTLKSAYSKNEWVSMIIQLYEHGPRGVNLWVNFKDDCNNDVTILGRNLKARIEEWNEDAW